MDEDQHIPIEEMDLFRRYVEIADWAWDVVSTWPPLAVDTVGKQLVRALDRVGATLVEGDGRYGSADAIHFFVMGRASAREARYWIQRAIFRDLISTEDGGARVTALTEATRMLNGLIRYRRAHTRPGVVRERQSYYLVEVEDPFTVDLDTDGFEGVFPNT